MVYTNTIICIMKGNRLVYKWHVGFGVWRDVHVRMYVSSFIGKHGMSKRIHLQKEYRNKISMYKFKVTYYSL